MLISGSECVFVSKKRKMAKDAGVDLCQFAREHTTYDNVSATSAIPPTAKSIEKVGKSSIFGVLDSEMAVGGMAEVAENSSAGINDYTFLDEPSGAALRLFR